MNPKVSLFQLIIEIDVNNNIGLISFVGWTTKKCQFIIVKQQYI